MTTRDFGREFGVTGGAMWHVGKFSFYTICYYLISYTWLNFFFGQFPQFLSGGAYMHRMSAAAKPSGRRLLLESAGCFQEEGFRMYFLLTQINFCSNPLGNWNWKFQVFIAYTYIYWFLFFSCIRRLSSWPVCDSPVHDSPFLILVRDSSILIRRS